MDDVEAAGAQLTAQPHQGIGEGREVGDGAVGAVADRPAQGNEVVGRPLEPRRAAVKTAAEAVGGIPGSEDADVITTAEKLLGQRLHMPVHASLICPGVGRNQRDAHRVRVPRTPVRLRSLPGPLTCFSWLRTKRVLAPTSNSPFSGSTPPGGAAAPANAPATRPSSWPPARTSPRTARCAPTRRSALAATPICCSSARARCSRTSIRSTSSSPRAVSPAGRRSPTPTWR